MKTILYFFLIFLSSFGLLSQGQFDAQSHHPDSLGIKQTITMSLSKKVYKEYEPLLAKFELINYDDKPFNVFNMFEEYLNYETTIKITDDLGEQWNVNHSPGDRITIGGPNFVLQPKDTLIVSMPINNWCERYRGYGIFGEFGYFPSGRKYKALFINNDWRSNLNEKPLISDTVEFEVIDPDEVDSQVIQLQNDVFGKITEDDATKTAASKFPTNEYTMCLRAVNLTSKYYKYKTSDKGEEILKDYKDFFKKFPDSFYLYNERFMRPLYEVKCSEHEGFGSILSEIKRVTASSNYSFNF